ncbi:MAG: long-chain-fatty-acid-CoA ligase [Moraxellaceae bacterium]|jgi:long-chain acyl-CoA synthetase|nr:long-chain-fatty-acid-CoA ligase [Moraxellaceae bacterium]
MSLTQGLHRALQTRGNNLATIHAERRRTWREVGARVARLAGALRALGVGPEDRAAILSLNSDRYVEYFYAVAWAGAACNPVNIRLAPAEIAYTLNDSGSRVLFIDATFAPLLAALRPAMTTVEHIIYMGDGTAPDGCLAYEQLVATGALIPDAAVGGDALAGLFYTGGTTGKSKGVMLTHANLVANALNVLPALGYDAGTIYLHAAPMFHLADMASTFAVTMAGATHCAVPRFDVENVLSTIARERVTHTLLVPVMINLLVSSGKTGDYDISSLRRLMYGASPMPRAVLMRAMREMPGVGFTQGYGQTEASPVITFLSPEQHAAGGDWLQSAGQPAYGVDVRILDANDGEVPPGTIGEVCARGPNVMRGYWKMEPQTRETLRNGWLHTGDLGYMSDDGFVFIVDRAKDMIITGGENVFSVEVEGAIHLHPGVQECAVIGIPDEKWGECVHAIVVPRPGENLVPADIIFHCRARIAGYKIPRSVEIRNEPLPLSGAGKVLKTELRKPYWSGRDRQVS